MQKKFVQKKSFPLSILSENMTESAGNIWSHLLKKSLMENFIFCPMVLE